MGLSAYDTLLQYINEHLSSYLATWKPFLHHSMSNTQKLQEMILAQSHQRGLSTHLLDNDRTMSELATGAPYTLLLAVHYDKTISISAQSVPLLASFLALDAYQACNSELAVNIKWLFDGKDTSSYAALGSIVTENRSLLQADACISYDIGMAGEDAELLLGAKGYLCAELSVQTAQSEPPSSYGTIAPNAAWRLLWALNTLKDAREDILIEGFYDTITPLEDEAIAQLHLSSTLEHALQQWHIQQPLMGLHGQQLQYAHSLTPTCTINAISSGQSQVGPLATIPSQASAQIDLYLVPQQDPHEMFTKLQQHLSDQGFPDVQARLLCAIPPTHTPASHPFVQKVYQATSDAYKSAPRIAPLSAKSTPLTLARQTPTMPIVLIARGPHSKHTPKNALHAYKEQTAAYAQQIALIFEALSSPT